MTQVWTSPDGERLRWYHLPGGGIDEGETAEQAATRELFEETGLRGTCGARFLTVATRAYRHHYFLFECDDLTLGDVTGPEASQVDDLGFEATWASVDDLASMPLWPPTLRAAIADYVRDGTTPDAWIEIDDARTPWHGTAAASPPATPERTIAVVVRDGDLLVTTDSTPTLPEVTDEFVTAARLAVVEHEGLPSTGVRTYVWATLEPHAQAPAGTAWMPVSELARRGVEPAWLGELLPAWIERPNPPAPDRFYDYDERA